MWPYPKWVMILASGEITSAHPPVISFLRNSVTLSLQAHFSVAFHCADHHLFPLHLWVSWYSSFPSLDSHSTLNLFPSKSLVAHCPLLSALPRQFSSGLHISWSILSILITILVPKSTSLALSAILSPRCKFLTAYCTTDSILVCCKYLRSSVFGYKLIFLAPQIYSSSHFPYLGYNIFNDPFAKWLRTPPWNQFWLLLLLHHLEKACLWSPTFLWVSILHWEISQTVQNGS